MYRKTSFGTQSGEGSRFVECILTTVTTLKLQRRGVLSFLTDSLTAHRRRQPTPSLLPTETGQLVSAPDAVNGYGFVTAIIDGALLLVPI